MIKPRDTERKGPTPWAFGMGWVIRSSLISVVNLKIISLPEKLRSGVTTSPTPTFPEAALPDAELSVPTRNWAMMGVYSVSLIGGLPLLPHVSLCLSPSH